MLPARSTRGLDPRSSRDRGLRGQRLPPVFRILAILMLLLAVVSSIVVLNDEGLAAAVMNLMSILFGAAALWGLAVVIEDVVWLRREREQLR